MKTFGLVSLALTLSVVLGGYLLYKEYFPIYLLRYRLTVVVEADGVVHTGSGVIEISDQIIPRSLHFDGVGGGEGTLHGYAITIDLRQRGPLFVAYGYPQLVNKKEGLNNRSKRLLPDGTSLGLLPIEAYRLSTSRNPSDWEEMLKEVSHWRGSFNVPIDMLPILVRICSEKAIDGGPRERFCEVNPLKPELSLGAGAKVLRASLEMVDAPLTPQPSGWPEWLRTGPIRNFALYSDDDCCRTGPPELNTLNFREESR